MSKLISLTIVILVLLNLTGCEKTPMQKLASDTSYSDMNGAFLSKEQEGHTELWNKASDYCKQHTDKPNCSSVILVTVISNGNTKLVPLNSYPIDNP